MSAKLAGLAFSSCRACTRKSPSVSTLTVPGVKVIEFANSARAKSEVPSGLTLTIAGFGPLAQVERSCFSRNSAFARVPSQ